MPATRECRGDRQEYATDFRGTTSNEYMCRARMILLPPGERPSVLVPLYEQPEQSENMQPVNLQIRDSESYLPGGRTIFIHSRQATRHQN